MKLIKNMEEILKKGNYGLVSQKKLNYILAKKEWVDVSRRPLFLPRKSTVQKKKKMNDLKFLTKWGLIWKQLKQASFNMWWLFY